MIVEHRKWLTVWVGIAVLLTAAGCQEQPKPEAQAPYPQEFLQQKWEPQEVPVAHIVRRDYRLREGDFLESIYHVRYKRNVSYRIKIQDIIAIRFPFDSKLDQTEQVQSDGTLHLDLLKKPVYVFDRTIDEVRKELVQRYSKYIKAPVLTVSFKQSNVKIAELKEAIKTAPRGQSRLVPIAPDGNISLPFIVSVCAAGRTIGQLHRALNDAYMEIGLDELEVAGNLQTISPIRVFVLGEVKIPGAHPSGRYRDAVISNREITLIQALSYAGSYIPQRADLSKVMLIRRRHLNRPQIAMINVYQLLENRTKNAGEPVVADSGKWRYDIWLEDGDIIYVPTHDIAKRADYIEYVWTRGIRAVGGFTSSAGYTVADDVDWLGPNP